jgi:2-polyprenyl-3-methyl-5-hydroxy-6-metoxy-1,4-benzoquinol methylase
MNNVIEFYDQLAADYHLIYADRERSIARHSEILDRIIRSHHSDWPLSLLDCSCGIGTQAIGMAQRGYEVYATDISSQAVKRLLAEAEKRGVEIQSGVADMRTLDAQIAGQFDVVISCDNSVPHLLSDDDLYLAARSMRRKVRDGGLLLISIRDYDKAIEERPRTEGPRVLDGPDGRRIVFQVWDWEESGHTYILHQFILREVSGNWITHHFSTSYRALLRRDLDSVLTGAGFTIGGWLMSGETGYHQPIVVARG